MNFPLNLDLGNRRILAQLNADPCSSSYGCFDRAYWGWKKKDFADSTLQFAMVPLLESGALDSRPDLARAAFKYTVSLVYSNGSCDQSYPFENHPKTFLDLVPLFTAVLTSSAYLFNDEDKTLARKTLKRGLEFASKHRESYGFIANHACHDLYQYLLAYHALHDESLNEVALNTLHEIEQHTHEEGWQQEYLGADPGYQTRGLAYLTRSISLIRQEHREQLSQLCRKSADFLRRTVLPDGTTFAAFGCRNTELVYPSGICDMAKTDKIYGPLAKRVLDGYQSGVNAHPLTLDFDNFIRLHWDFLRAHALTATNIPSQTEDAFTKDFVFSEYGLIHRRLSAQVSLFIQGKLGGAYCLYKGNALVSRNAGYLLQLKGKWWGTKNLNQMSQLRVLPNADLEVRSILSPAIHKDLTPSTLLAIRLLNLTLLRFWWAAEAFRWIIVKRLVTGTKSSSFGWLRRTFKLGVNSIVVYDFLQTDFVPDLLVRTSRLNLFHMASSRYLHGHDVNEPPDEILEHDSEQFECTITHSF